MKEVVITIKFENKNWTKDEMKEQISIFLRKIHKSEKDKGCNIEHSVEIKNFADGTFKKVTSRHNAPARQVTTD